MDPEKTRTFPENVLSSLRHIQRVSLVPIISHNKGLYVERPKSSVFSILSLFTASYTDLENICDIFSSHKSFRTVRCSPIGYKFFICFTSPMYLRDSITDIPGPESRTAGGRLMGGYKSASPPLESDIPYCTGLSHL